MARRTKDKLHAQNLQNKRLIKALVGLLAIALVFSAGFLVRGNTDLLARFGFDTGKNAEQTNPGMTVSGSTHDSLAARVAEVQGILQNQSFDDYDLENATEKTIATLAEVTGDPTLRYYDAGRYAAYLKDVSGSFAGVGVLFAEYKNRAYVVDVFEGSEAEGKDVRTGDFVVAIDGDRGNNGGWTQAETVKAVSREAGESVVLTFRRPATIDAEGGDEYTVTLECAELEEKNITSTLYEGRIGYIKLSQITQNADALVEEGVAQLLRRGAGAFVLDLRDCPGGFLTQSVDIASLFIKSGVVVEIQTKEGIATRNTTSPAVTDVPLVVLVNMSTAGTAEVLAGALQDNSRATIVGQRTMGKGSVQSVQELSFGGALRYTSAYYKTPNGYDIEGRGINPDIQVAALTDEGAQDNQLSLAIDTAFTAIGGRPSAQQEDAAAQEEGAASEGTEEDVAAGNAEDGALGEISYE